MIMSVDRARELLGEEAAKMIDDQVAQLINDLDGLATAFIRAYRRGEIKMDEKVAGEAEK